MSAPNMIMTANQSETKSAILVHEAINEEYEWVQYNKQLRLIHSIKDDMYQMKSIVDALSPPLTKEPRKWLELYSTKELIKGFEELVKNSEIQVNQKIVENRSNLATGLRGWYCHRLIVNLFAAWVSPRYAFHIAKLLDDIAAQERAQMENMLEQSKKVIEEKNKAIEEKSKVIEEKNKAIEEKSKAIEEKSKVIEEKNVKINEMKPRQVPLKKEKNYKYMIWKEELPDEEDKDMIKLHLVRRNRRVFSQVSSIKNDPEKCWFFRENLPIAMTPNEDVKNIVKQILPGSEYDIKACDILTYKEHLPKLHEAITKYFDEFQN